MWDLAPQKFDRGRRTSVPRGSLVSVSVTRDGDGVSDVGEPETPTGKTWVWSSPQCTSPVWVGSLLRPRGPHLWHCFEGPWSLRGVMHPLSPEGDAVRVVVDSGPHPVRSAWTDASVVCEPWPLRPPADRADPGDPPPRTSRWTQTETTHSGAHISSASQAMQSLHPTISSIRLSPVGHHAPVPIAPRSCATQARAVPSPRARRGSPHQPVPRLLSPSALPCHGHHNKATAHTFVSLSSCLLTNPGISTGCTDVARRLLSMAAVSWSTGPAEPQISYPRTIFPNTAHSGIMNQNAFENQGLFLGALHGVTVKFKWDTDI